MTSSVISPHTAAVMVAVNGIAKVVLGIFQNDAKSAPLNP
jgi:hypothetical protein